MRHLVAAIAIALFAALLPAMATNRAQVAVCWAPDGSVGDQEQLLASGSPALVAQGVAESRIIIPASA